MCIIPNFPITTPWKWGNSLIRWTRLNNNTNLIIHSNWFSFKRVIFSNKRIIMQNLFWGASYLKTTGCKIRNGFANFFVNINFKETENFIRNLYYYFYKFSKFFLHSSNFNIFLFFSILVLILAEFADYLPIIFNL